MSYSSWQSERRLDRLPPGMSTAARNPLRASFLPLPSKGQNHHLPDDPTTQRVYQQILVLPTPSTGASAAGNDRLYGKDQVFHALSRGLVLQATTGDLARVTPTRTYHALPTTAE
jgi:hypothetical protein